MSYVFWRGRGDMWEIWKSEWWRRLGDWLQDRRVTPRKRWHTRHLVIS